MPNHLEPDWFQCWKRVMKKGESRQGKFARPDPHGHLNPKSTVGKLLSG
jgi:hypothetical protein